MKRNPRSYKITDKAYIKAQKRAKRNKVKLANIVEVFVTDYSEGAHASYNFIQKSKTP